MSKKVSSLKGIIAVALVFVLVLAAGGCGYFGWLQATAETRAAEKAAAAYLASCKMIPAEELVEGIDDAMIDGEGVMTMTATASGVFGDPVTLKMRLEAADGAVSSIEVVSHNETPDIGGKALSEDYLTGLYGTTYGAGLDAYAGATMTSKAIFACIDAAEAQFEATTGITPAPAPVKEEPVVEAKPAPVVTGDGVTYEVSAKGVFGDDVVLNVTLDNDGAVSMIEVVANNETPGIGSRALEDEFLSTLYGAKSSDGLDALAGATMTSKAIFACIDDAAAQFANSADAAPAGAADGNTYQATAKGVFGDDVVLNVTFDDEGAVSMIEVVANNETPGIGSRALEESFLSTLYGAKSSEGLDALAGATMTSKAVFACIDDAAAQFAASAGSAEASAVEGNTYEVTAKGVFGDDVVLNVTLDDEGAVSMIEVVANNETPGIGSRALEESFLSTLYGAKSSEGLDALAGATMTSKAIFACIDDAAAQFAASAGSAEEPAEAPAEEPAEAPAEEAVEAEVVAAEGNTYEVTAKGVFGDDVVLNVTLDDEGAVSMIEVVANNETPGIGSRALEDAYLSTLYGAKSSEGLDALAGATMTSKAIFACIDDAAAQFAASAGSSEEPAEAPAEEAPVEEAPVEEAMEEPAAAEEPMEEPAKAEELPAGVFSIRLVSADELVEGVTKAMVTNTGKVFATTTTKGVFGDDVVLKIIVDANGAVSNIEVIANNETPGIGSRALEAEFLTTLNGATSGEGLDALSGATMTSNAIFAGIQAAVDQFAALK